MKKINKGASPGFFELWKINNPNTIYSDLERMNKPLRNKLRLHLAKEQGDICCYCCCRLIPGKLHTEHIKPQTQFQNDTMDYTNMLASCNGYEVTDDTCGHRKNKWYSNGFVSPLDADCESRFEYTLQGRIKGKDADAQETVDNLNLSVFQLNRARQKIISLVLHEIDIDQRHKQELLRHYRNKDANGQYQPFSPAAVYAIQHL